jgi:hypothetical protein
MNEELELLDKQLELMLALQYIDLEPEARKVFDSSITRIRAEYEAAAAKRDAAGADEETRKYYAGICQSIAGALPNITKGALSASSAFQRGDYMNGAAALMDICAAAAPILGSLFAAGGPPGALIGALFSVVGQLLSFFGPKQPSLKDEIKDMMLGLESEAKLNTMKSIGDSIDVYFEKMLKTSKALPGILALPLKTEKQADTFIRKCGALKIGLERGQARLDTPAFANWEVLEWLRTADRQDLDKWPEVLGVFCQSYTKLISANILFGCISDRNVVSDLLEATYEGNNESPLPPITRSNVHWLLNELLQIADAYADDWASYNNQVLSLFRDIEQAGRLRGLFMHIGDGYLYAGSGRKDIVSNNSWHYLRCGPDGAGSGAGYITRMATTLNWGDAGSPMSPYHCFLVRPKSSTGDLIEYRTIRPSNPPTNAQPETPAGGTSAIRRFPGLERIPAVTDVHAVPGGWPDKPNEVWLYVAAGSKVIELELNEQGALECRGWQSRPAKSQVMWVRSVYPASVGDDPDGDLTSVFTTIQPRVNTLIHYGGLANSPDIFVVKHADYVDPQTDAGHGYVPAPWSQYAGIGVDERFLWVFGTGGFACASHTSVLKAFKERAAGKSDSKPRWIEHYPNKLLYKGLSTGDGLVGFRQGEPPLEGLRDLAPCDDGTVMASLVTRSYDAAGKMQGDDGPFMCTARCQVDIRAGNVRVGTWTKLTGGPAAQVQKQPIYCWPTFESLQARLVAEGQKS